MGDGLVRKLIIIREPIEIINEGNIKGIPNRSWPVKELYNLRPNAVKVPDIIDTSPPAFVTLFQERAAIKAGVIATP